MGRRSQQHFIKQDGKWAHEIIFNIIREMQIEMSIRHHYTPISMTKILDNLKCWWVYKTRYLTHAARNASKATWKIVWWYFIKINTHLTHRSCNPTPRYLFYLREVKICIYIKTCMHSYSNFIYNSQKLEKNPTFLPMNGLNGILLRNEKEETTDPGNTRK